MERKLHLWIKILIVVCIVLSFVMMVKNFGAPSHENIPLSIVLNDEKAELSPEPLIIDERAMVPVRAFGDYIGASVEWDSEADKLIIDMDGKEIVIASNRKVAKVNGEDVVLSTVPVEVSGTVYAPVTVFADTFGYEVEFEHDTKTVTMTK